MIENLPAGALVKEVSIETETVGRVITEAKFENLEHRWEVERGLKSPEEARGLVVSDALVDPGATRLSMPTSMIRRIGLTQFSTRRVLSSAGYVEALLHGTAQLTIQGSDCRMDVLEDPDGVPVRIGPIPLDRLDFVVDMRNRTLIGNPAHGGEQLFESYGYR